MALAGRELGPALDELQARLADRPGFYRGTAAVANFGATRPSCEDLGRLYDLLSGAGIEHLTNGPSPDISHYLGVAAEPSGG